MNFAGSSFFPSLFTLPSSALPSLPPSLLPLLPERDLTTRRTRSTLLSAIRTATLRHDVDLQATLLPLLLRNYLDHGLYEQADRLVSKTVFPEGTAQNAQLARWFYYVGRIRAIQLNYTAAHSSLLQAIRRAPSDMSIAPGFFQHAYKLAVVVELLMGEIPERKTFREEVLKKSLRGYLEVAQGSSSLSLTPQVNRY